MPNQSQDTNTKQLINTQSLFKSQSEPKAGQTPPSNSNGKPKSKPKPTPQEARQNYQKWLERLQARAMEDPETKERFARTQDLTARLEEPNILAVYRLIEIFGVDFVQEKVEQALALHKKAKETGEAAGAYKPKENPRATRPEQRWVGTEVANSRGEPRSLGGVFFFIMRGHVNHLRLLWENLGVPWLPGPVENTSDLTGATTVQRRVEEVGTRQVQVSKEKANPEITARKEGKSDTNPLKVSTPVDKVPAVSAGAVRNTINSEDATKGELKEQTGTPIAKPSRGKVVITGRPITGTQPKVAPQGLVGVLELLFEIEPGGNPPKGLPVLEKTLVKIWCTEKQYNKVKDSLTPDSRFLIEGEIGAGINSQSFQPFIRVICTRLTTLELEQEYRQKRAE